MPRVNGKEFPYTAAGMAAAARERAKKRLPKRPSKIGSPPAKVKAPNRPSKIGSPPAKVKAPNRVTRPNPITGRKPGGKVKAPNRVTRPNMAGRKPGRMQRRGY